MLIDYFEESIQTKREFIQKNETNLNEVIEVIKNTFENWNKILIAGNGWSAADSQHFAAECISRYKLERKSIPAIALTTDTSVLTAIWNDYSFDNIFARQLEWLGSKWDIFIWLSTSWNSKNIIEAIHIAQERWIICIWILWNNWWMIKDLCDYSLVVPSCNTPRIQETHQVIYHTICEEVEKRLFTKC